MIRLLTVTLREYLSKFQILKNKTLYNNKKNVQLRMNSHLEGETNWKFINSISEHRTILYTQNFLKK